MSLLLLLLLMLWQMSGNNKCRNIGTVRENTVRRESHSLNISAKLLSKFKLVLYGRPCRGGERLQRSADFDYCLLKEIELHT